MIGLVDMMSVATVLIKWFSADLRLEKVVSAGILPMIGFPEHFLEISNYRRPRTNNQKVAQFSMPVLRLCIHSMY